MKDPQNCPYCEAEEKGCSEGWGLSPEGWDEMLRIHNKYHLLVDNKVGEFRVILPQVLEDNMKPPPCSSV